MTFLLSLIFKIGEIRTSAGFFSAVYKEAKAGSGEVVKLELKATGRTETICIELVF